MGEGIHEIGKIVACHHPSHQLEIGREIVSINSKYFRPTEVKLLISDPVNLKLKLGCKPKHDLPALVKHTALFKAK